MLAIFSMGKLMERPIGGLSVPLLALSRRKFERPARDFQS
jgi:hypothetical protein